MREREGEREGERDETRKGLNKLDLFKTDTIRQSEDFSLCLSVSVSIFLFFLLGILETTRKQKGTQQYDPTAGEVGVSDEEYGGPAEGGGAATWEL